MAINPSLLVSAAMLQDYLVDNATGLPLANGTVTLWKDNARFVSLKNWYYLTGSPGSYTYTQLPNPMTLSAVGTIQDGNGNDVIPFYYPVSEVDNVTPELYYVTVTNSNGQQQFVRQNFPFGAFEQFTPTVENDLTLKNYIVNNVFWRNAGTVTDANLALNPLSGLMTAQLAPSAHDGFSMPDWEYISNVSGGNDTLTFTKFSAGQFLNPSSVNPQNLDVTPEYFLNFNCSGAGTSTYKYIQVPISLHLKTLETAPGIVNLWYRLNSSGGAGGYQITVSILAYAGTGVTSPVVIPSKTITMNVNGNFTKQSIPVLFPSASGVAVGNGGDDAFYLQIGYPVGQTFSIDIAKPQLYIGNEIASNDFDTYDQADQIISSPRTGDIRSSLNAFYPFGWVPMNDGTIGDSSSNATTRANQDTWQLFNLLWSSFSGFTSGTTNPICQMYNSSGTAVSYGGSAIADFSANNQLALTKMMGKVLMGTVPLSALLPATPTLNGYSSGVTFSNSSGNLLVTTSSANLLNLYLGSVVTFAIGTSGVLPTGITPNTLYYATPLSTTTFLISTTFANAVPPSPTGVPPSAPSYVAFTNSGTPPNNAFAFFNGSFEGEYVHMQQVSELAAHTHNAVNNHNFLNSGTTSTFTNINNFTVDQVPTTGGITGYAGPVAFNVVQPSTYMNFYIKL